MGPRRAGAEPDDGKGGPGGGPAPIKVAAAGRVSAGGGNRQSSHRCQNVDNRHDKMSFLVLPNTVALLEGRPLETVTPDRGKEFAGHADVTDALGGVQFYFCDPHYPWQKPTVENTNGLLREFFPNGTDFGKVTDEEVQHAVGLINDRPRKVLKYRTANEVYREMLHSA